MEDQYRMDNTPRSNRLHIAIFGRRNAGKSSLINALTNQDIALVSSVPGTTTDPVYKSMELLPLGPVVFVDTAGIDDVGTLGEMRVRRTLRVLRQSDLAVLVIDPEAGVGQYERDLLVRIRQQDIPVVAAVNKVDLCQLNGKLAQWQNELGVTLVPVSTITRQGIDQLKEQIIQLGSRGAQEPTIIGDLISPGDTVVLVVPIDTAMPKGRLILPQVQTIRDILDHDACAMVTKERELKDALSRLKPKPRLVVTDSQAFMKVAADVPRDVPLTSFSILYARYKGDLETLVAGVGGMDRLEPGDRVLISEACTHHRQPDDIGTVQIPRWLRQYVGGDLKFEWTSGTGFPDDLAEFKLVVHCGGCMINRREMLRRLDVVESHGVPIVNYGVLLARIHKVLQRALEPLHLAHLIPDER